MTSITALIIAWLKFTSPTGLPYERVSLKILIQILPIIIPTLASSTTSRSSLSKPTQKAQNRRQSFIGNLWLLLVKIGLTTLFLLCSVFTHIERFWVISSQIIVMVFSLLCIFRCLKNDPSKSLRIAVLVLFNVN